MEVRCTGCNKLFRVSDDKITGSGIKFACTRCGIAVKITAEQFEQYTLSREAASALASFEPKPSAPAAPELKVGTHGGSAPHPDFDLSDPATAAAAMQQEEHPPVFVKPDAFPAEPVKPASPAAALKSDKPAPKPAPGSAPARTATAVKAPTGGTAARPARPEVKPAAAPRTAGPVRPAAVSAAPRPKETPSPALVFTQTAPESSGKGKKAVIVVLALVLLCTGGFFAKSYFGASSSRSSIEMAKEVTPEGLHIMNASGGVDPVSGDLIISGVIENTTDTPRPAWYMVVDLFDAQGMTLMQAKLVSGKQFYTRRDMDILGKRGVNLQEFKTKQLQEQGVVVPARGSVTFELHVYEPPVGVANFNANLQPFDPVKLYKEMLEAQK